MNQMTFDWNEAGDAVVQPTMWATAVYISEVGNVVIRQEPAFGETEDHMIVLAPPYAIEVAKRILAMVEATAA